MDYLDFNLSHGATFLGHNHPVVRKAVLQALELGVLAGYETEYHIELARQVMAWRSPTDFLLPAPMPGLLSSVPRIGEAPAGSPLQALDPGRVLGPPVLPRSPRS